MRNTYSFNGMHIRSDMIEEIRRYVDHHVRPSGFLAAVICNNLQDAVFYADDENLRNLPAFVAYFYDEAPSTCWGSVEKMQEWLKARKVEAGND